jgi:hypothetical protein
MHLFVRLARSVAEIVDCRRIHDMNNPQFTAKQLRQTRRLR